MIAKLSLTLLLVATAIARPDKPAPTGYNYQAPARSFSPRQRYQAPESPEVTYDSPEQTYEAPESPEVASYEAPRRVYKAPASPEVTYEAPDSPERTYEAPSQPQRAYSAPAQPQRPYSAPSQPERAYSAPAQPERAYSAPAQPERAYSAPSPTYAAPEDNSEEDLPLMPFDFGYIVDDSETENAYGHKSNSDGEQVTGQYRVLLPDGRTQIVTYTADKENGFQAQVTYEGEARPWVPPTSDEQQEASYQAPVTRGRGYE